jgi:hypothetical protein
VGNVQASGSTALKGDIAPLTYDNKSCLISDARAAALTRAAVPEADAISIGLMRSHLYDSHQWIVDPDVPPAKVGGVPGFIAKRCRPRHHACVPPRKCTMPFPDHAPPIEANVLFP